MFRKRHSDRAGIVIPFLMLLLILELLAVISFQLGVFERPFWLSWVKTIETTETTEMEDVVEPYLHEEEIVVLEDETIVPVEEVLFEYVRVTGGCGPHYEGDCLLVRSGPGVEYPVVYRLRNEVVLKVGGKVQRDGMTWYKIIFDEYLRYPERLSGEWYLAAEYVEVLLDEGDKTSWEDGKATSTKKHIVVDRSAQTLAAYDGEELFMEVSISTGLELTPTPRGTFYVFKKTPSRYMQGPLPGLADQQVYDLPGVPWNLYFTQEGAVIHGAFWHTSFGHPYSHGCVNVPPKEARELYAWAELGTKVVVKD